MFNVFIFDFVEILGTFLLKTNQAQNSHSQKQLITEHNGDNVQNAYIQKELISIHLRNLDMKQIKLKLGKRE